MQAPFPILQQSPLDGETGPTLKEHAESPDVTQPGRFVPSRYNARSTTATGDMVLWNSYTGCVNSFPRSEAAVVAARLSRSCVREGVNRLDEYLYARGYLVNEGVDELRRVRVAFGRKHYRSDTLELILLASEDCNFRCVYCYEKFEHGTMQPQVRTAIKKLVERRAAELKHLTISWFGGEPLYGYKAIKDLAPSFVEVAAEHGISLKSHMTTNGYLLTEEVARSLLSWKINEFQITLDGTPEQHDCRRTARDGSGTYQTILNNLISLHKTDAPFHVAVRLNYDRESFTNLDGLFSSLRSALEGDPRFVLAFHPISPMGGENDQNLAVCGVDEMRQARTLLPTAALAKGLKIESPMDNAKVGSMVCYAARPYNFIIGATGKVMKCTVALDYKDHNVIGHVTEDGQLLLSDDKLARWIEPAFETDQSCQQCQLLPPCQGMLCPLERIEAGRRPCPSFKGDLKSELNVVALARG